MKRTISASEVNRLGDRLRDSSVPTFSDLAMLTAVQAEYLSALDVVHSACLSLFGHPRAFEAVSLAITSRPKTLPTLTDKLRRGRGLKLSKIQDLVGARITGNFGLSGQDRLAATLLGAFPTSKLVDRRSDPRSGYRAVHAILAVGEFPVEVQIRTVLQDLWANAMERQGDVFGRGIRYDAGPEGEDPEEVARRAAQVEASIELAGVFARRELETEALLAAMNVTLFDAFRTGGPRAYQEARRGIEPEIGALAGSMGPEVDAVLARCSPVFADRIRDGLESLHRRLVGVKEGS